MLSGTHPDVTTLATNKVTIGIDDVRQLILTSEQMPSTAPWRIIIIEDVDRMLERTTNVLLKEIEEPSPHTIWLLCAPSAQDVLPTIRSRTRIVNLAVPSTKAVADYLMASVNPALPAERQFDRHVAVRAARLAEGHIGIAELYASDTQVMSDRDELIVGLLGLRKASDAVLLADDLIDTAKSQAEADVNRQTAAAEADFRRINGLGEQDRIPPKLRGAYNAIAKKDEIKRRATRRSRDVLDRALELGRQHLPRHSGAAEQRRGRSRADQHGEPHGHRRAVGTAEPSGSSRSVGGHHRGQEAVARQRQPDAGVRGAVLRADSGEAMTAPGQERTTVEPRTINWGSSEMCAA